MKKVLLFMFVIGFSLVACGNKSQDYTNITDFQTCLKTGYQILESYPRQCKTPDGRFFIENLTDAEKDKLKTGLPNPASVFCINQGGSLEIKSEDQGSYGLCRFEDGSECEEWAFYRGECGSNHNSKQFNEEESMEVAKIWILTKSPTYRFDGSNLLYEQTQKLDCPDCYQFIFSFESSSAGFGDRTDLMVAQVITPHVVIVNVEKGRIVSAITDNKYDEIKDSAI